jgi:hypothetical protein
MAASLSASPRPPLLVAGGTCTNGGAGADGGTSVGDVDGTVAGGGNGFTVGAATLAIDTSADMTLCAGGRERAEDVDWPVVLDDKGCRRRLEVGGVAEVELQDRTQMRWVKKDLVSQT